MGGTLQESEPGIKWIRAELSVWPPEHGMWLAR
jgi:hypothetical protein